MERVPLCPFLHLCSLASFFPDLVSKVGMGLDRTRILMGSEGTYDTVEDSAEELSLVS